MSQEVGNDAARCGAHVQVLQRWRYYDPMLGQHVAVSHLMDASEAQGLDPGAKPLPGTEVTIDHTRPPVPPRWR